MNRVVFLLAFGLVAQSAMIRSPKHLSSDFILAQVKSSLTAQGPLNEVYELLDKLESDIKNEQVSHDELRDKQTVQCAEESEFRKAEIEDANFAIQRATTEKENCESGLEKSSGLLEKNLEDRSSAESALQAQHDNRKRENELYVQRSQDHTELIAAIDRTVVIVNSLLEPQSTGAFIQLNRQLTNLLVVGTRSRQTKSVAPVITAMVQIALNKFSSQSSVQRVLDLLETLRANTQDSQSRYDEEERVSIENYNKMVSELTAEIQRLTSEEAVLRKHIEEMSTCVKTEGAVLEEAQAKLARNSELLQDSDNLCKAWEEQYTTESQNRAEELVVIADLREITKRRLTQIKGSAAERGDQDKFDEYNNKYEYEEYKKFQNAETTYDEKGAKGAGFERKENLED